MATKIREIAVKTGEYQDRQSGQMKGRWQNVGSLMKNDDGGEFIILHRWFNPAGVPNPENKDSVLLSCFKQDRQQGGYGGGQQPPPQQQGGQQPMNHQQPGGQQQGNNYGAPNPGGFDDFDDEIPF